MDLAAYTTDQLFTMARNAYKAGIQFYDQADRLMNELMAMPGPLTPGYRELKERYSVVRAYADALAERQMAISAEIDRRDVLRRRDEILAEQQVEAFWLAEAEKNEEGKQADA